MLPHFRLSGNYNIAAQKYMLLENFLFHTILIEEVDKENIIFLNNCIFKYESIERNLLIIKLKSRIPAKDSLF